MTRCCRDCVQVEQVHVHVCMHELVETCLHLLAAFSDICSVITEESINRMRHGRFLFNVVYI